MKAFLVKVLKTISIGKYPTTLYNKSGTTFQGSIIGGIVSIMAFGTIGYLLVATLVHVFLQTHYNVDV